MSDSITTAEAAALLGLGRKQVQKLTLAGVLRVARRVGRSYLLDRASVEAYKPGKRGWPAGVKRGPRKPVTPPSP